VKVVERGTRWGIGSDEVTTGDDGVFKADDFGRGTEASVLVEGGEESVMGTSLPWIQTTLLKLISKVQLLTHTLDNCIYM
jgi:hypothetical protein